MWHLDSNAVIAFSNANRPPRQVVRKSAADKLMIASFNSVWPFLETPLLVFGSALVVLAWLGWFGRIRTAAAQGALLVGGWALWALHEAAWEECLMLSAGAAAFAACVGGLVAAIANAVREKIRKRGPKS